MPSYTSMAVPALTQQKSRLRRRLDQQQQGNEDQQFQSALANSQARLDASHSSGFRSLQPMAPGGDLYSARLGSPAYQSALVRRAAASCWTSLHYRRQYAVGGF